MQKMLGYMRKAIQEFDLIQDGDKIAVGVSGGKDSLVLLKGLVMLKRFIGIDYEVVAITLDPGFNGVLGDYSSVQEMCDEMGIKYILKRTQIGEIVFDIRKEKNPCSLCANLRRGIINSVAIREGCNKIALGHNKDDVLETFLLNLLYAGIINTFAPVSYMDRTKITLIRPLIYAEEKDTRRFIKKYNIDVMPKACPMDGTSKRETMKNQIYLWQKEIPTIKANLFGAIQRTIDGWAPINPKNS